MKRTGWIFISLTALIMEVFLARSVGAQTYDWSGLYAGINGGGSWGKGTAKYRHIVGDFRIRDLDPDSAIVGGTLGYNVQNDFVVLGIETDMAWRHGTAKKVFLFPNGVDVAPHEVEQNWFATLRPRFGFNVNPFLIYGTAGLAVGNLEHKLNETRPGVASRSTSSSGTEAGWTIGGGVDFGINRNWAAGVDYLYMDFGESKIDFPPQTVNGLAFPASSTRFSNISHIVRAKLIYRF